MIPNDFSHVQADKTLCTLNQLLGSNLIKGVVTHEQSVHYGKTDVQHLKMLLLNSEVHPLLGNNRGMLL